MKEIIKQYKLQIKKNVVKKCGGFRRFLRLLRNDYCSTLPQFKRELQVATASILPTFKRML